MLYVDIVLLLLVGAALIGSVVARAPKPFRDPPRHVLICVAHSDDCVILGAEYAYGAIQQRLSVRVAYLTCSGPHPEAEISQIRRTEALAAWSTLGVPEENFIFADLAQSPVEGPSSYSDQDTARARELFKAAILLLPKNAAVIVPAEGESHVDHRTVRKVSLQAICDSKREDLIVYESPEYNMFLSLVHCPNRTIRTLLRKIPSLTRLIKPYAGAPNYVNGPPGFVFGDTPGRLAKKRELLTYFASQDGDLLVRFFGYETPYRRLAPSDYLRESHRPPCVPAFGCCCDLSASALAIALLCVAFLTAYEVSRGLTITLSDAFPVGDLLLLLGFLFAITYLVRSVRQNSSLETSLFAWAASLGLISGAF